MSRLQAEFACGQPSLDTFLRTLVSQYEKHRLGRTYVAVETGQLRVAGYYTLAAGSFDPKVACQPRARKKLTSKSFPHPNRPYRPPGCRSRLRGASGARLGETLLFHALRAAVELSEKLGAFAVDVWAVDEAAHAFYRKYGFIPLEDSPLHLYLPLKTISGMFA